MIAPLRVAVSAAILRGDAILLVEFDDPTAVEHWHFNLPGGGVELGETLPDAVRREVFEETASFVEVGRLLLVWEYVPEQQSKQYGKQQSLRLVFEWSPKRKR